MSSSPKPKIHAGSRLALNINQSGLTVYGNKAGLLSVAERLLRIAQADPSECFECHVRMELDRSEFHSEASLTVDEQIAGNFLQLSENAPEEAVPCGFELTFMHVNETALDEEKQRAST